MFIAIETCLQHSYSSISVIINTVGDLFSRIKCFEDHQKVHCTEYSVNKFEVISNQNFTEAVSNKQWMCVSDSWHVYQCIYLPVCVLYCAGMGGISASVKKAKILLFTIKFLLK